MWTVGCAVLDCMSWTSFCTHMCVCVTDGMSRLRELDFVMVAGHFLARDENIFSLFEGGQQQQQAQHQAGQTPTHTVVEGPMPSAVIHPPLPSAAAVTAVGAAPAGAGHGGDRGATCLGSSLQLKCAAASGPSHAHPVQHQAHGRWVPSPPLSLFEDLTTGAGMCGPGLCFGGCVWLLTAEVHLLSSTLQSDELCVDNFVLAFKSRAFGIAEVL